MSRRQETEFVRISAVKLLTLHACRLICLMTIGKILGQSNPSLMPIWLLQHRYSILLSSSILWSLVVWLHISVSFNTHEVFCIGLAACQLQLLWCQKADFHIPSIITPYKNRKMPGIYFVNIKGIFPHYLSSLSFTFLGSNIDRFWESRKILGAGLQVRDSIISHGCFLRSCNVEHSIVGIRSRIEDGSTLKVCNVHRVKRLQSSSLGVLDCLYQSCIVHKHIQ